MKDLSSIALVMIVIALFILATVPAHGEVYPGAFHVGDCNGDGFIDAGDLSPLKNLVVGLDAGCPNSHPPSSQVMELDGDRFLLAGDLSIMKSWVQQSFINYGSVCAPGKACGISIFTPTVAIDTSVSNTVDLKAWTYDSTSGGDGNSTPRAGYGIVFQIDPASPCPGAFLYGRDPAPLPGDAREKYISGQEVFEYTWTYLLPPYTQNGINWWPQAAINGGVATVQLNAGTCAGGSVYIDVFIPDDTWIREGRGTRGRFPAELDATGFPAPIVATVVQTPYILYQELLTPMVEVYSGSEFCWSMLAHWSDGSTSEVPTASSYVTGNCYQTSAQCAIGSTGICNVWDFTAVNSPVPVPIM